ncbi:MAG: acyltransferase family protein [Rhodoferax sp.]
MTRRADIQGLRALAVLLVIVFHAGLPLPGGFAGVDVFFVISGFVITQMLAEELAQHQRINLTQFYLRRIRRLLPALATLSVSVALLGMLFNPIGTQVTTALSGMATSLFVVNGYLYRSAPGYFSPGAEFNPMLHTWSLSVEEQFYFIFPLLLALGWAGAGKSAHPALRRFGVIGLIALLLGLSFWLSCGMSYGQALLPGVSAPARFAFYASPTRAWEFAAGALLALGQGSLHRLPAPMALAVSAVGLVLLAWSALALEGSMVFPGWVAWVPVGSTLLLIAGGSAAPHGISRMLSSPLARWIGDRSYGWYLWHWPMVVFAKSLLPGSALALVLASAFSLLPAWASYRYIETPLRAVGQPSAWATYRLAALCMVLPMLAFAGLLLAHRGIEASVGGQAVAAALQLPADEVRGCEGAQALQRADCTWPVAQARGRIVLLGDSNAGHLTEPVLQAAQAAGYALTVATLPACPWVDLQSESNGIPNQRCQDFVRQTLAGIGLLRPSLVILAMASDGYIEEPGTQLRAQPGSALARSPADKAALWTQGLSLVLGQMGETAPVLLVHPVPRFRTWTLAGCTAWKVWLNPAACAGSVSRMEALAWRSRAVASEQAALAQHPDAKAVDFTDLLCPAATCTVTQNGRWMFRDGAHLSVPGALTLAPRLQTAIEQQARPTVRIALAAP